MPSVFSHAVAAAGIGACFYRPGISPRILALGAVCATLPDLDVIGFRFGIGYGDMLGHRGLSHSLPFAAALATMVVGLGFRHGAPGISVRALWTYLFLATASHGLLDGFTDGGLGVAFFAPFSGTRYFFPARPIEVSPIGIRQFFTDRGSRVLMSELVWVWLPAALLAAAAWSWRRVGPAATGGGA